MTGVGPIAPTLQEVRILLRGAKIIPAPLGTVMQLCIMCLCLPWEAVGIDIERIDWGTGFTDVPARGGRTRRLYLPAPAMKLVLTVAGSAGGTGQAVTAGRGVPLQGRHIRLDRIQKRLAEADPATGRIAWNFHGIRAAGRSALEVAGTPDLDVLLGLYDRGCSDRNADAEIMATGIERWCALLLSEPGMRPGKR
ncbi:hypothetical protein [Sphingomonas sp. Leaf21]|uniref:hypothetical protein n=1 Tax=Sphingomonas sp. Leaf21 TaxID=2876550 RepID=UPI001E577EBD|nr:hypothetical protein [Sphingomonas sp. Leaf21]